MRRESARAENINFTARRRGPGEPNQPSWGLPWGNDLRRDIRGDTWSESRSHLRASISGRQEIACAYAGA